MSEVTELRDVCAEAARRGGAVLRERWKHDAHHRAQGRHRPRDRRGPGERGRAPRLPARPPPRRGDPGGGVGRLRRPAGSAGELRFYVDPLDGTTNYAHGVPHFAVNVAVADGRGLAAGGDLRSAPRRALPRRPRRGGVPGRRAAPPLRARRARGLAARHGLPLRHPRAPRAAAAALRRVPAPGAGGPPLRLRRARPRLRRLRAVRRLLGAEAQAVGRRGRDPARARGGGGSSPTTAAATTMLETGDIVAGRAGARGPMLAIIAEEREPALTGGGGPRDPPPAPREGAAGVRRPRRGVARAVALREVEREERLRIDVEAAHPRAPVQVRAGDAARRAEPADARAAPRLAGPACTSIRSRWK